MDNTQEQANILTEEDLNKISSTYKGFNPVLLAVIDSHRALCSANAELSFEIMMRKKYEGFLRSVIACGEALEDICDFEWFKEKWQSIENLVSEVKS